MNKFCVDKIIEILISLKSKQIEQSTIEEILTECINPVEEIVEVLNSPEINSSYKTDHRRNATIILTHIDSDESIRQLENLLHDTDSLIVEVAIAGLINLKGTTVGTILFSLFESKDENVLEALIYAMGDILYYDAIHLIAENIDHENTFIGEAAEYALEEMLKNDTDRAVKLLAEHINTGSSPIKLAIIGDMFIKFNMGQLIKEKLENLLDHKDDMKRKVIQSMLVRLDDEKLD